MIMKVLIVKERKKVFINFNTMQHKKTPQRHNSTMTQHHNTTTTQHHNTTQHNTTQHADYVGQRLFVKQFNPFLSVFYMLKNGFFILNGGDCCD